MSHFGPRLRLLFLLAVAVGAMLTKSLLVLSALTVALVAIALAVALSARAAARQLRKLLVFALLIVGTHAFFGEDGGAAQWTEVAVLGWTLSLDLAALELGAAMALRVVALVFASHVARAGDPRAVAEGLRSLRFPAVFATSVDAVLALLAAGAERGGGGGRGRGGGRGGGGGGGGGGGRGGPPVSGAEVGSLRRFWDAVKRMASGDVTWLTSGTLQRVEDAERHALGDERNDIGLARDVGVIAGLALSMLMVRAVKILPAIPFAPGHKLVLLTPLYVLASLMTRGRAGATWVGATMGVTSFLLGDGKYGVFEIAKHVVPGILCDLVVPQLARGGRRPGRFSWGVVSGVVGACRFAAIFVMTLVAQPPAVAFAFLLPGLAVHTSFGIVAGLLVPAVLRAFEGHLVKGVAPPVVDDEGSSVSSNLSQPPLKEKHEQAAGG